MRTTSYGKQYVEEVVRDPDAEWGDPSGPLTENQVQNRLLVIMYAFEELLLIPITQEFFTQLMRQCHLLAVPAADFEHWRLGVVSTVRMREGRMS